MPAMCWQSWSRKKPSTLAGLGRATTDHVGAGAHTRPSRARVVNQTRNPASCARLPGRGRPGLRGSFIWAVPLPSRNLLRVVIFHPGLVAKDFVVRGLKQLLSTVAQLRADGLLHARVGQFTLPCRFPLKSALPPEKPANLLVHRIGQRDDGAVLTWFQFADRIAGPRVCIVAGTIQERSPSRRHLPEVSASSE